MKRNNKIHPINSMDIGTERKRYINKMLKMKNYRHTAILHLYSRSCSRLRISCSWSCSDAASLRMRFATSTSLSRALLASTSLSFKASTSSFAFASNVCKEKRPIFAFLYFAKDS